MIQVETIRTILTSHKEELRRRFGVKEIAIFGSVVRGDATERSDVDLLVEFERPIGFDFVRLADELEAILDAKVDLVSKSALNARMFATISAEVLYA